ncbi:MAG: iron-containing alcohol dehydrogenase [bacterium]|nr:iron-containing alcohol dehydrogenase [bacterium]
MTITPSYLINNCAKMTKRKWLEYSVKKSLINQAGRELLIVYSPCVLNLGWLDEWMTIFQERSIKADSYKLDGEPSWNDLIECRSKISSKTRIWGLGGGSVMDLAKLVSVEVCECDRKMNFLRPKKLVQRHKVWLFPTHYSSSSYVSSSATLIRDRHKISGVGLTVEKVFIDPNVLKSVPEKAWIYGSIDTVAHFVEILCSVKSSDSLRIMALTGWWDDYLKALENYDYESLFYLAGFLYGELFELYAVSWPMHHIAHELGPKLELNHGETLALILPLFLRARLKNQIYENLYQLLHSVSNWINMQPISLLSNEQLVIFDNLNLWNEENWFDPNESCNSFEFKEYLRK